jgi:DNA sulfur modification protein DndD
MYINSITLNNFRTFYGVRKIDFSINEAQPVTIFIGENGAGKTTLLNAVFWGFTGRFSKQFDSSESIINRAASEQGVKTCSVEISFSNEDITYSLERVHTKGSANSSIRLSKYDKNSGHLIPVNAELAEREIEKYIPNKLASWFFFDGEAIGALHLRGDSEFKKQLRQTFGFSTLEKLKDTLTEMEREYTREEARSIKSARLDEINEQLDSLDSQQKQFGDVIDLLRNTINVEENKKKDYEGRLLNYTQAEPIQNKRNIAVKRLAEEKNRRDQKIKVRNDYLIKNLPKVILNEKMTLLIGKLNQKEEDQTLPEPFGTKLIDQVKFLKKCICGTEVLPGSKEDKCLEKMLERASTGELMQKIFSYRSQIGQYKRQADEYHTQLDILVSEIQKSESEIAEQELIIRKADEDIRGINIEEVRQLREKRDRSEAIIRDAERDIGSNKSRMEFNRKDISVLKIEQDRILAQQNHSTHIRAERQKVTKILSYVTEEFKRQEAEVLDALNLEISGVLDTYLTKNYSAKVDPDSYEVKTYDVDGKPVSLGTGESNMLKFAVIAAIVGMAGSRTKISKVNWISEPIIAPLMFDAPFSVIDPVYRAGVTKNLSDLASQLILLFDSGKWDDELFAILNKKIGKTYLLVSRAKGPEKSVSKSVEINGKTFDLNEYGERDETLLKEIRL